MPRSFSKDELNKVIAEHRRILGNLEYISSLSHKYRAAIDAEVKSLVGHGVLQNLVYNEGFIDVQESRQAGAAAADNLLKLLYAYTELQGCISAGTGYLNAYKDAVQRTINVVSSGRSSLGWIFSSGQKKVEIENAFAYLNRLLSSEYGQVAARLSNEYNTINRTPNDVARAQVNANKSKYLETLLKLMPNASSLGSPIPEISQVNKAFDLFKSRMDKADRALAAREDAVKLKIGRLVVQEAMESLKEIPVTEIGNRFKGLRVKNLMDAGYNTFADIFAAGIYNLASVHGISEDTAARLKKYVQEKFLEIKDLSKIRLSLDNINDDSTGAVQALYDYIIYKRSSSEVGEIYGARGKTYDICLKNLQSFGNGIRWLFYIDNQKENIRRSYTNLKSFLGSGGFGQISKILAQIEGLKPSSTEAAWDGFKKDPISFYNAIEDIVPGVLGNDNGQYGLPEDLAREIQEVCFFPEGLNCTLRRYQEWGVRYIIHQGKVLLGDEMGLGKTIQAIAAMVSLKNVGATHFVVVCPASVVTNWCREIRKHSKLSAIKVHGNDKHRAFQAWLKNGGVAVTTYENAKNLEFEENQTFEMLIVDEAHYIKNPEAARSRAVAQLCTKANRLLFMTGTALENRVDEMIELIKLLNPPLAEELIQYSDISFAKVFRDKLISVYYRRKREDVLTELPKLTISEEWCKLGEEEKRVYEAAVLDKRYSDCRRVSFSVGDMNDSVKAARMKELVDEAKDEGRKVIVFSFFLDTISKVCKLFGDECYGPINGSVPVPRRQEIIDEFENAPAGSVLAAQIQSGGTGLNIQSASVVILCEPQFKPSIENQAISRAYRMGQSRNVLVYKLLCEGTVEEKMMERLERKQQEFDAFADRSVAAETAEKNDVEIDSQTFGQMINEEIERIKAERGEA